MDVRLQLEKILASDMFADSGRMQRFLRLAVEHKLSGAPGRLKETIIGVEVFDKKPAYDPRLDPIVRVEARRLRSKLQLYYEGPGRDDTIVIELPKGCYAPVIRSRDQRRRVDRTIAVLPFANLSPTSDDDYFSDGLTEELIHALTKVPGLSVVAWNSAARLKERQDDIGGIREQLNATHVLRGSLRKTGERLRITAQLIETEKGVYLWSETYDRRVHDVFAIQEQIAVAIANALELRLSASRLITSTPGNIDYYNLYLKGRFQWNARTADGLKRSIAYFEQAVALDDTCALAYTGLADAYTILAAQGLLVVCDTMRKAKVAAERALELDPVSAEACTSLALIRSHYDWQWAEAGYLYRRAINLNPGYVTARHWRGIDYLAMLGRLAEAQAELDIARQLDPLSAIVAEGAGFLKTLDRKYGEAIEDFRRLLEMDPAFYKGYTSMGRAYSLMGEYGPAIEMLEKGRTLAGDIPSILGALGQTHALAGNTTEARHLLAELQRLAERQFVPQTALAAIHMGLGENDKALSRLEYGADRRELSLAVIHVHPMYDSLRPQPRFPDPARSCRIRKQYGSFCIGLNESDCESALLVKPGLEIGGDKLLHALPSSQTQPERSTFALQPQLDIKKRTTQVLAAGPFRH